MRHPCFPFIVFYVGGCLGALFAPVFDEPREDRQKNRLLARSYLSVKSSLRKKNARVLIFLAVARGDVYVVAFVSGLLQRCRSA